jgi:hypothetical protein
VSREPTVIHLSLASSADMERIVVLADGETFAPFGGRPYLRHPGEPLHGGDRREALREDSLIPIIEFCSERPQPIAARWVVSEEDEGIFVATNGAELVGPFASRAEAEAEAEKQRLIEAR